MRVGEFMAMFDTNHDGKISQAELGGSRACERAVSAWEKLDHDDIRAAAASMAPEAARALFTALYSDFVAKWDNGIGGDGRFNARASRDGVISASEQALHKNDVFYWDLIVNLTFADDLFLFSRGFTVEPTQAQSPFSLSQNF